MILHSLFFSQWAPTVRLARCAPPVVGSMSDHLQAWPWAPLLQEVSVVDRLPPGLRGHPAACAMFPMGPPLPAWRDLSHSKPLSCLRRPSWRWDKVFGIYFSSLNRNIDQWNHFHFLSHWYYILFSSLLILLCPAWSSGSTQTPWCTYGWCCRSPTASWRWRRCEPEGRSLVCRPPPFTLPRTVWSWTRSASSAKSGGKEWLKSASLMITSYS